MIREHTSGRTSCYAKTAASGRQQIPQRLQHILYHFLQRSHFPGLPCAGDRYRGIPCRTFLKSNHLHGIVFIGKDEKRLPEHAFRVCSRRRFFAMQRPHRSGILPNWRHADRRTASAPALHSVLLDRGITPPRPTAPAAPRTPPVRGHKSRCRAVPASSRSAFRRQTA